MNNKMLHRGSMAWLTSTETNLSVLSTCILLLIQFQTFHALPTSSPLENSNSRQQHIDPVIRALSSSTVYGSAYPYSSYRPGARLDSYRPYSGYPKDSFGPSSGLYAPDAYHPNSVYSRQSTESFSSPSETLNEVLKRIEQDIVASGLQQQENDKKIPTLLNAKNDEQVDIPEQQIRISLPRTSTIAPVKNNRPRLLPLPSVRLSSTTSETNDDKKHQNSNDKEQQPATIASTTSDSYKAAALTEEPSSRSAEFSPVPPPFAPELDPEYERRQYGLGALTLLDQAGPFW